MENDITYIGIEPEKEPNKNSNKEVKKEKIQNKKTQYITIQIYI